MASVRHHLSSLSPRVTSSGAVLMPLETYHREICQQSNGLASLKAQQTFGLRSTMPLHHVYMLLHPLCPNHQPQAAPLE